MRPKFDDIVVLQSTYPYLLKKLQFWFEKREIDSVRAWSLVIECIEDLVIIKNLGREPFWRNVLDQKQKLVLYPLMDLPKHLRPLWRPNTYIGGYSVLQEPVTYDRAFFYVTLNSYCSLVLNQSKMFIADIDIDHSEDGSFKSVIHPTETAAKARLQEVVATQKGDYGYRLYRTRNGLRIICHSHEIPIDDPLAFGLLSMLGSDPLYIKLCTIQDTYRARLTVKPWRVNDFLRSDLDGLTRGIYPIRYLERLLMNGGDDGYSVCHFLGVFGAKQVLPEFEGLINMHDSVTGSFRFALPLA